MARSPLRSYEGFLCGLCGKNFILHLSSFTLSLMTTVISVENLSKSYRLGQIGTGTFSNDLKLWWAKMRGKPNPLLKIGETDHGNRDGEELWALRDISFTVQQGEVLGIIGKNGAGKSTLLKILSRVTAPTSGVIKVKGRIASLLEVGTGFHPELTGRENIYLNGAILGMTRQEVARKFDEIVDFSGVEKFIDTPVKRYSSGMYVRLAFAVAAHLEPEILVVDEVLAVGDAEFQKKCLGKMGEVAQGGRTVLFVSHNMGAIRYLCSRAMLIEKGHLRTEGDVDEAIHMYNHTSDGEKELLTTYQSKRTQSETPYIKKIEMIQIDKRNGAFHGDLPIEIKCNLSLSDITHEVVLTILIRNEQGVVVVHTTDEFSNFSIGSKNERNCIIPPKVISSGKYYITLALGIRNQELFEKLEDVISFYVEYKYSGKMDSLIKEGHWRGVLSPYVVEWI